MIENSFKLITLRFSLNVGPEALLELKKTRVVKMLLQGFLALNLGVGNAAYFAGVELLPLLAVPTIVEILR